MSLVKNVSLNLNSSFFFFINYRNFTEGDINRNITVGQEIKIIFALNFHLLGGQNEHKNKELLCYVS